ncbi:MAG: DUF6602 domain-containing protein [Nannocystaceae bacterium]
MASKARTERRKAERDLKKARTPAPVHSASPRPEKPTTIFEEWARFAIETLRNESDLAGAMVSHGGRVGNIREQLIQSVLKRVLPTIYEIGTGHVVDYKRGFSKQIDIVISRRDFPALRFNDGSAHYLAESVLAAIEIKSELSVAKLHEALDVCKSVGDLTPQVDGASFDLMLEQLPGKYRRTPDGKVEVQGANDTWSEPISPTLQKMRLIGRPATYVFGFKGYSSNIDDFRAAIKSWLAPDGRVRALNLAHVPSVIVSEGCLAVCNRNCESVDYVHKTWPLLLTTRHDNPLGYFVTHLLLHIGRRMLLTPDIDGVRPAVKQYLVGPDEGQITGQALGSVSF